jgi:hypothetical protein
LPEPEPGLPGGVAVQDELAGHVRRHQVGGELHPLDVEVHGRGQGLDDQRLGHPRDAFQEHVAARQQRGHEARQRAVLADDQLRHLVAHGEDGRARITPARGVGGLVRHG